MSVYYVPGTVLSSVVMLLSIKIPIISAYIDPFALTKVHLKGTDLTALFQPDIQQVCSGMAKPGVYSQCSF